MSTGRTQTDMTNGGPTKKEVVNGETKRIQFNHPQKLSSTLILANHKTNIIALRWCAGEMLYSMHSFATWGLGIYQGALEFRTLKHWQKLLVME